MPYLLDGRRLRVGRPFTHTDGRQFGGNWDLYTTDELTAIGIKWEAEPAPFDPNYYASAGNPLPLDDSTDSEGVTTYGVRPPIIQQQKDAAASQLSKTDWYVTRKSEKDTAIPSKVTTYRDAVRTACVAREAEIAAVKTTEALETLMKTAPGETGALTSWPSPLS